MTDVSLRTIGVLRTPFPEKFGVPRQAGLVPDAIGELHLDPDLGPETVRALSDFSHVWVVFVFHALTRARAARTVRPPRLGGNTRVGSLATRSGYRPNPIGLSVCELLDVAVSDGHTVLRLAGVDAVDGTPVLDVKPYLPWADSHPEAQAGWAAERPAPSLEVSFTPEALAACAAAEADGRSGLQRLVEQLIALDPRPGYRREGGDCPADGPLGLTIQDVNVRARVSDGQAVVLEVRPLAS